MGAIKQAIARIENTLRHPSVDPYFTKIENTIHLPRKYLATALLLVVAAGVFIGYVNQMIVILGFIYPAYKSIKAIESCKVEDDTKWLIYWVVYSTLIIVEYFSDWLLFWVPFYYLFKSILLIWCMHPNYNGSEVIYKNIIRPLFISHEEKIDQMIQNVQKHGASQVGKIVGEVGELGSELGEEIKNNEQLREKLTEGVIKASVALNSNINLSSESKDQEKAEEQTTESSKDK